MTLDLSDQWAIGAIRDGNTQAFQGVFDTCFENLCQYAFTIVRDMDEAEDIVQSIFARLWERRKSLDVKYSIRSYLFKSVHNQCINQLEHRTIKRRHQENSQQKWEVQSPEVFPHELEDNIKRAIDALPPQCRAIFLMSRYDELRHSEIA